MKRNLNLQCTRHHHSSAQKHQAASQFRLNQLCTHKKCPESFSLCCTRCKNEFHKDHAPKIVLLSDFLKQQLLSLNQFYIIKHYYWQSNCQTMMHYTHAHNQVMTGLDHNEWCSSSVSQSEKLKSSISKLCKRNSSILQYRKKLDFLKQFRINICVKQAALAKIVSSLQCIQTDAKEASSSYGERIQALTDGIQHNSNLQEPLEQINSLLRQSASILEYYPMKMEMGLTVDTFKKYQAQKTKMLQEANRMTNSIQEYMMKIIEVLIYKNDEDEHEVKEQECEKDKNSHEQELIAHLKEQIASLQQEIRQHRPLLTNETLNNNNLSSLDHERLSSQKSPKATVSTRTDQTAKKPSSTCYEDFRSSNQLIMESDNQNVSSDADQDSFERDSSKSNSQNDSREIIKKFKSRNQKWVVELRTQVKRLTSQNEVMQTEKQQLEEELNKQVKDTQKLLEVLKQREAELKSLRSQQKSLEVSHQNHNTASLRNIKSSIETKIAEMKKQLEATKTEKERLIKDIGEAGVEIGALKKSLEEKQVANEVLKSQIDKLQKTIKQNRETGERRQEELEKQVDSYKDRQQRLIEEISALKTQIEQKQQEFKASQEQMMVQSDQLKDRNLRLESQIRKLEECLEKSVAEAQKSREEVDRITMACKADITELQSSYQSTIQAFQIRETQLKYQAERQKIQNVSQVQELRMQLQTNIRNNQKLQEEVTRMSQQQKEKLLQASRILSQEIESLTRLKEQAHNRIISLTDQYNLLQQKMIQADIRNGRLVLDLQTSNTQLLKIQELKQELEGEVQRLRETLAKLDSQKQKLHKDCEELRCSYVQALHSLEDKHKQLLALQSQLGCKTNKQKDLQVDISRLSQLLRNREDELHRRSVAQSESDLQKQRLQAEIMELRKQLSEYIGIVENQKRLLTDGERAHHALSQRLSQREEELKLLLAAKEQLELELRAARETLLVLRQEIDGVSQSLNVSQSKNIQLKQEAHEKQSFLDKLSKNQKNQIELLEEQLKYARANCEQLAKDIERLQNQYQELVKSKMILEEENQSVRKSLQMERLKSDEQKTGKQVAIRRLSDEVNSHRATILSREAELARVCGERDKLWKEVQNLNVSLKQSELLVKELSQAKINGNTEINKLQEEFKEVEKKYAHLKEATRKQNQYSTKEREQLQNELNQLKIELNALHTKNQQLNDELQKNAKQLQRVQTVRTQDSTSSAKLLFRDKEYEIMQKLLASLKEDMRTLQSRIRDKELIQKIYLKEIQEMKMKIMSLHQQLDMQRREQQKAFQPRSYVNRVPEKKGKSRQNMSGSQDPQLSCRITEFLEGIKK